MIWDIAWGIILALVIISVGLLAIGVFFAYWRQILVAILSLIIFAVGWHYIGLKWMLGIAGGLIILIFLFAEIELFRKSKKERCQLNHWVPADNLTIREKRKQLGYDE